MQPRTPRRNGRDDKRPLPDPTPLPAMPDQIPAPQDTEAIAGQELVNELVFMLGQKEVSLQRALRALQVVNDEVTRLRAENDVLRVARELTVARDAPTVPV